MPDSLRLGAKLPVTTDSAVSSFSLVRTGAATHSTDNDQRRVSLRFRETGAGSYELQVPADPGVVLPGRYTLFALNDEGVGEFAGGQRFGGERVEVLVELADVAGTGDRRAPGR
ncbi:galactose oxidase early set domain-containing protein [Streptomyces sp. SYSU K21746]